MRVYISADIEGITGVSKWDETTKGKQDYEIYREQMTREVAAACEGAMEAGADYLLVKDAHEDGKNLIHNMLPKNVKVISGWSNHPYSMVEGLDESFDAAIFIGYHSGSYSNGSPLSHTLYPDKVRNIIINGKPADEFMIHALACYHIGVPVAMVSGDGDLMRQVRDFNAQIQTVAVQEGFGGGIVSIHPDLAVERINRGVKKSLEKLNTMTYSVAEHYVVEIEFVRHEDAYKFSFYPGAEQVSEYVISLSTNQYMDVLTLLLFLS